MIYLILIYNYKLTKSHLLCFIKLSTHSDPVVNNNNILNNNKKKLFLMNLFSKIIISNITIK